MASALMKKRKNPAQGKDWTNTGSFINKPARGWLHPDEQLEPDAGVCYGVRYIGGMEVKQSMKTLDFDTRTAVAKESISQICDSAGLKSPGKKTKRGQKISRILGESPNMMFAGLNVNLTITTEALTIMNIENGDIIGNHAMPSVSFASGGDADTMDFVAYVAKDANGRACHVLECGGGLAQDVITTIGQAFELRYKMYLARRPDPLSLPDRMQSPMDGNKWGDDDEYYNDRVGAEPPLDANMYSTPHSNRPVSNEKEKDLERDFGISATTPYDNSASDLIGLGQSAALYDNKSGSQGAVAGGGIPMVYDNHAGVTSSPTDDITGFEVESEKQYDNRGSAQPQGFGGSATYDNRHNDSVHSQNGRLDAFDMSPFNASVPSAVGAEAVTLAPPPPVQPRSPANPPPYSQTPDAEPWFHGRISRDACDRILIDDGDFLVRESKSSPGQFVLSGRHGGQIRHLLLVDPEGVVRTKDRTFNSVSHLVNYHMERELPITSTDSELLLRNPVARN